MRAYSLPESAEEGWTGPGSSGNATEAAHRPPTHGRHQGQPWFAEPAFVLFTAFRSRVESVPGPGPERRACSLHEAPSC